MSKIELKSCPFCGGKAEVRENTECGRQYYVGCTRCPADVGRLWFWKMSDAIEAWNTRADLDKVESNLDKNGGWIPCSGCGDCKNEECEHYGKVL